MALPPPPPTSQASGRPLFTVPDGLGYVYFNKEQTTTKLQQHLLIHKAQFDAIIADVDHILSLPSNFALCRPGTRIRGRGICADVRQIALDIQQRHANNCRFTSHPDVQLLQCSLWDIVKKRIALIKHTTAMNNSGQMFTPTSPVNKGDTSTGKDVTHLGQKHMLEDTSPTLTKKPRTLLPRSTPAPYSSPSSAPTTTNHLQPQAIPFNNCTTRVTGSKIASEFHAPLMRYLLQTNRLHTARRVSDFDYDRWFLDLQLYLDFDPARELLQYRTPYGGAVFVRNTIEWRCAISEMVSTGKTVLDFEIVKHVPGFTPVNGVLDVRPNGASFVQNSLWKLQLDAAKGEDGVGEEDVVKEKDAVKKISAVEVTDLSEESFSPVSTRDASTMTCVVTFKVRG